MNAKVIEATGNTKDLAASHSGAEPVGAIDWQAMLNNPYTWIALSFLIFVALFFRYLLPLIVKNLDGRAEKIRDQLEQATRLREQAQALLATYKAEQEALLKEAEHIIAAAKMDAAALRANAAEELKAAMDRRTQQAKDKIARAEAEAVNSIRERIITNASDKARALLASQVSAETEADALARALSAIEQQVH